MKRTVLIHLFMLACIFNACSQNKKTAGNIGGPCEGCEAIYESPVPFELLPDVIKLPDWNDDSSLLGMSGVVYQPDGKTPAAGVILYVYHTDHTGVYPTRGDEKGWGKRHGYIRGWVKTNEKGEYKFGTRRPAAYPGRTDPAHIHITIKEPGKNEYWIDDFVFDDDPLLTKEKRSKLQNRGGSGILVIHSSFDTIQIKKAERNIILGKNIPGYKS